MHYPLGIIIEEPDDLSAKNRAEDILEPYYNDVYDWYSEGWDSDKQTIYRATEKDFWDVVDKLREHQKNEFEAAKKMVKPIETYINLYESGNDDAFNLDTYYLHKFTDYVYGKLQCDSYIFDGEISSAVVNEKRLEKYRKSPEDYCIVLFDIHA